MSTRDGGVTRAPRDDPPAAVRYKLDEINEGFDALSRGEDGRGVIIFE